MDEADDLEIISVVGPKRSNHSRTLSMECVDEDPSPVQVRQLYRAQKPIIGTSRPQCNPIAQFVEHQYQMIPNRFGLSGGLIRAIAPQQPPVIRKSLNIRPYLPPQRPPPLIRPKLKKAGGSAAITNITPIDIQNLISMHEKPRPCSPVPEPTANDKRQRGSILPAQSHTLIQDPRIYYMRGYSQVGKLELQSALDDFKGSFKCSWCDTLSPTNIAHVFHLKAHLDQELRDDDNNEAEPGCELEEYLRCPECRWTFQTPHEAQTHLLKLHSIPQPSAAHICYICSAVFSDSKILVRHMQGTHTEGPDAPYWCKVCRYRSSLYQDIRHHYVQEHSGTRVLYCPLCLFVGEAFLPPQHRHRSKTRKVVASTKSLFQHIVEHLDSEKQHHCNRCILVFPRESDLLRHLREDHTRTIETRIKNDGPKLIRCIGYRPVSLDEENPTLGYRRLIRPEKTTLSLAESQCVECRQLLSTENHFTPLPLKCVCCGFQTNCYNSHFHHMLAHARPTTSSVFRKTDPISPFPLACSCGFATTFMNRLTGHLKQCTGSDEVGLPVLSKDSDEVDRAKMPLRMLRGLRLADAPAFKRVKRENDDDSEVEDEEKIEVKRQAILERNKSEASEDESSFTERPQLLGLLSPRRKTKAAKPDNESKTPLSATGKEVKEETFVGRGASASAAGERYKQFRDNASALMLRVHSRSVRPKDNNATEPETLQELLFSLKPDEKDRVKAKETEEKIDKIERIETSEDKMETSDEKEETVEEDDLDYTDLLAELGIPREEENSGKEDEDENLFSRLNFVFP